MGIAESKKDSEVRERLAWVVGLAGTDQLLMRVDGEEFVWHAQHGHVVPVLHRFPPCLEAGVAGGELLRLVMIATFKSNDLARHLLYGRRTWSIQSAEQMAELAYRLVEELRQLYERMDLAILDPLRSARKVEGMMKALERISSYASVANKANQAEQPLTYSFVCRFAMDRWRDQLLYKCSKSMQHKGPVDASSLLVLLRAIQEELCFKAVMEHILPMPSLCM